MVSFDETDRRMSTKDLHCSSEEAEAHMRARPGVFRRRGKVIFTEVVTSLVAVAYMSMFFSDDQVSATFPEEEVILPPRHLTAKSGKCQFDGLVGLLEKCICKMPVRAWLRWLVTLNVPLLMWMWGGDRAQSNITTLLLLYALIMCCTGRGFVYFGTMSDVPLTKLAGSKAQ